VICTVCGRAIEVSTVCCPQCGNAVSPGVAEALSKHGVDANSISVSPGPQPPAGWYPNPYNATELRYWDGVGWTGHIDSPSPVGPMPIHAGPRMASMASKGTPSFPSSIGTCLKKYCTFSGRARRSEFWWFDLFYWLMYGAVVLINAMMLEMADTTAANAVFVIASLFSVLVMIGLTVPRMAVSARRLHDTGHSAWWILLIFVPLGGLSLLVWHLQDSSVDTNAYGLSPKLDPLAV
jgi:uncharacterized membrane protein YhaH (DUF805 family)